MNVDPLLAQDAGTLPAWHHRTVRDDDERLNDAIHQNMLRALLRVGSLTERSAAEHVGPWLVIDAGVDEPRFNAAVPAEVILDIPAAIDLADNWFLARGVPFRFHLRNTDEALLQEVRQRGFQEVDSEPAMSLSLDRWTPAAAPGIEIRQAISDADIRRYAQVDGPAWHEITEGIARTARSFPDFELFMGEVDGEAVATSMAVITGDIVGIFNVQAQPRVRGRGFGTALTAAAMEAGRRRGARTAALQATEMGFGVYRAMGFEERFRYIILARP